MEHSLALRFWLVRLAFIALTISRRPNMADYEERFEKDLPVDRVQKLQAELIVRRRDIMLIHGGIEPE